MCEVVTARVINERILELDHPISVTDEKVLVKIERKNTKTATDEFAGIITLEKKIAEQIIEDESWLG